MSHELPAYSTRTRPASPATVAHTNRPTVRWVIVRHTVTDPIELERAKALREQSRNIRFHKGSVTLT